MTTDVSSTHSEPNPDTTMSGPDPTVIVVAAAWSVAGLTEMTSPRGRFESRLTQILPAANATPPPSELTCPLLLTPRSMFASVACRVDPQ